MLSKGLQIQEMSRFLMDPDGSLTFHLQCNHYPPVRLDWLPVARKAIRLANEGRWDEAIQYPNGLERTVGFTIKGLRLETFLDN